MQYFVAVYPIMMVGQEERVYDIGHISCVQLYSISILDPLR